MAAPDGFGKYASTDVSGGTNKKTDRPVQNGVSRSSLF
jgi:hypothetical protein